MAPDTGDHWPFTSSASSNTPACQTTWILPASIVTVSETEVLVEGCVETDGQRRRVEEIARSIVAELPVTNKIEIVDLKGPVKQESLS